MLSSSSVECPLDLESFMLLIAKSSETYKFQVELLNLLKISNLLPHGGHFVWAIAYVVHTNIHVYNTIF